MWKLQLQLALYTALAQLTGSSYWWGKSRGLSKLKMHILRERTKVTRAFWLKIMWRDNWTCYLCGRKIPFGEAELEHDLPVSRWGYTTEENCHAADWICNSDKGTMTAAEFWQKQKKADISNYLYK